MWGGHMGDWEGGWGMGWGLFGMVHMILWWVLLVLAIALLAKWLFGGSRRPPPPEDRALAILRERYARGEIGKEEYEARRRDLGG